MALAVSNKKIRTKEKKKTFAGNDIADSNLYEKLRIRVLPGVEIQTVFIFS